MRNLITILMLFAGLGLSAQMVLSGSSTDVSCSGICDGSATVLVTGGSPPYVYAWSDSQQQSSSTATGLCAGTYNVTITDAESSVIDTNFVVNSIPGLMLTTDSIKEVPCGNECLGMVSISMTGGTAPYTYAWSSGGTTSLEENLCIGTHTVVTTDANGCTRQDSYQIGMANLYYSAAPTGVTNEFLFQPMVPDYFNHGYWDFGDGSTAAEKDPTHQYAQDGVYNVCLTVVDTIGGCQRQFCQELTVGNPLNYCMANFTFESTDSMFVHFVNTSQGGEFSYHWNFGDGHSSNFSDGSHEYANPGNYDVCLTVYDNVSGCQNTKCIPVTVSNTGVVVCNADFTFAEISSGFAFQNNSVGDIAYNHWSFGDGGHMFAANALHQYDQPGVYQVCLTVKDTTNQCQDMTCKNVIIQGPDSVMCNASFDYFPMSGNDVNMNPVVSGNVTDYFWNINDQATSYAQGGVVTFPGEGVFNVCLTVLDSVSGCVDTYCDAVIVTDSMENFCNANFNVMVNGMTAYCTAQDLGTVSGHMWSYGDGYFSDWENPTYEYQAGGDYEVCLTVYDTLSQCMDTHCETVVIEDGVTEPCFANFSFFYHPVKDTVFFQPQTSSNIVSYYWSFGDNSPAQNTAIPAHQYAQDGYYEVCLTVVNASGCQSSKCKVIAVGDVTNACFANFNYFEDNVTSTAHFDNKSLGTVDTYQWSFGDGGESFTYEPSHTYAQEGFYPACLTVSNSFGCERIKCKQVRVGNSIENPCLYSCVWPGDANNDLEANHYDLLPIGLNFGETGPARDSISSYWAGQFGLDWATFQWDGVNNKHGDCNGDGIIDMADILVLDQNFAYSHPEQPRSMTGEPLTLEILNPSVTVGEDIEIAVIAGEAFDIDLYGIGFEVSIDPSLFDFNTLVVDYSQSWVGTEGSDLVTFEMADNATSTIYIAESKNNQVQSTGRGEIARIRLQAIGLDEEGTEVTVTTNGGLDLLGDTVDFTTNDLDSVLITAIESINSFNTINIYPNPANDFVSFSVPSNLKSYTVNIYDLSGKRVYTRNFTNQDLSRVYLDEFGEGIYQFKMQYSSSSGTF